MALCPMMRLADDFCRNGSEAVSDTNAHLQGSVVTALFVHIQVYCIFIARSGAALRGIL